MNPGGYMWLGFLAAIVGCAMLVTAHDMGGWLMFSGGILFGKGYGVWEERDNRKQKENDK